MAAGLLIPLGAWLDGAPAWLTSAVLHLLLLVLCALLAIGADEEARLSLSAVFSEDLGEQLIEESLDLTAALEIEVEEQSLTPDTLPPVPDPLATPNLAEITPEAASFASDILSPTPGAALSGRMPGRREALLKAFGGTEETEAAVLEGLRWLQRQQQRDGGWSLRGPYPDGSTRENREAATGMALLAFQGAGHLPTGDGQFARTVRRGWDWLLPQQQETGSFFQSGASKPPLLYARDLHDCAVRTLWDDAQRLLPTACAGGHRLPGQDAIGGGRLEVQPASRQRSLRHRVGVDGSQERAHRGPRSAQRCLPTN